MNAKLVIVIVASLLGLCSCGPSHEEKAQQMAANYLKGELFHFDSYEPLQTKVDSAFVSLSSDKEAINLTIDLLKMCQSLNEYTREIENAERSMDIWVDGAYLTPYSRGEYNRAKEKRDNYQHLLEKGRERVQQQFQKIKARQAEIKVGGFKGWKVYHKFKSSNGARSVDLQGEYVFFCDKDFNEDLAYSKDDYDALSKIMGLIAESDDLSEFVVNVQDLML